jgi:uncharacterized membrane-anchored protein YhcB (DUF1043 family)
MVASGSRYTGSHLVIALVLGLLVGALTQPIWMYLTQLALPKDKMEIAQKISRLQSRIEDQMATITEESNKIVQLKDDLYKSQQALKGAKVETEQAKAATPHRYEVVKEGSRTWRLDTATGKTCLLLATEADWNKPESAAQNCELIQ